MVDKMNMSQSQSVPGKSGANVGPTGPKAATTGGLQGYVIPKKTNCGMLGSASKNQTHAASPTHVTVPALAYAWLPYTVLARPDVVDFGSQRDLLHRSNQDRVTIYESFLDQVRAGQLSLADAQMRYAAFESELMGRSILVYGANILGLAVPDWVLPMQEVVNPDPSVLLQRMAVGDRSNLAGRSMTFTRDVAVANGAFSRLQAAVTRTTNNGGYGGSVASTSSASASAAGSKAGGRVDQEDREDGQFDEEELLDNVVDSGEVIDERILDALFASMLGGTLPPPSAPPPSVNSPRHILHPNRRAPPPLPRRVNDTAPSDPTHPVPPHLPLDRQRGDFGVLPTTQRAAGFSRKCFFCRRTGHKKINCPFRNSSPRRSSAKRRFVPVTPYCRPANTFNKKRKPDQDDDQSTLSAKIVLRALASGL